MRSLTTKEENLVALATERGNKKELLFLNKIQDVYDCLEEVKGLLERLLTKEAPSFPEIPAIPEIPKTDLSETNALLGKLLDKDETITIRIV